MAEHAAVINVSRYRPAAGKRSELLSAMRRMADRAAQARGCFGAQACESDRDRDDLVAISRWESPDALRAFSDTAEAAADQEHLKGLVAGSAQRENLRPL
jgi:quinol monooxygenase YgiN